MRSWRGSLGASWAPLLEYGRLPPACSDTRLNSSQTYLGCTGSVLSHPTRCGSCAGLQRRVPTGVRHTKGGWH